LLGQATGDYQEKLRIAEAVGVNPITLMRWVTNKSNPRLDNLRPLLTALPQHRQQLARLIAVEYPQVLNAVPISTEIAPEIPSAFYARVLNAHTSSPPLLRGSAVSILILQQVLEHLDPQQMGMVAVIVQCMPPPVPGGKVRSLRKTAGRGNHPWSNIEHSTCLLGAEGQAGRALTSGRFTAIQTREEKLRLFPMHHMLEEESTVAYPVLLADRVAGCLCITSTRRNYFTQIHLDLIQNYADLLVLAFENHEFYPLQDIELGIMPPVTLQQPHLARFQQRVTQRIIDVSRDRQPLTRLQAELAIWREIEEELLHYPLESRK
jgi:hypothetical protein